MLSTANRDNSTILVTAYGERFSVKGFGQMISTAIREAGLPERCKAHGLRKAAARRLAEAGCSASEIAAITGHKTLAEVERYTRAADQERLARQAIQRQSENRSGKPLADEVANTTAEALKINSLMSKMALPREVHELNNFNRLRKSLGRKCFIELQSVSAGLPKLSMEANWRTAGRLFDPCRLLRSLADETGHCRTSALSRSRQDYCRPASVESEPSSTCRRRTAGQFKRRPSSSTRRLCFSIWPSAKARNSELLR
jgi:hypothetical protein